MLINISGGLSQASMRYAKSEQEEEDELCAIIYLDKVQLLKCQIVKVH
jgi:hypothetical protein